MADVMNSKKGMEAVFTMVLAVIIAAVVIILLIIIFRSISKASEEEAMGTRCKASLMAYSKLKSMPFGDDTSDEAKINCPTQYVTIESGKKTDMRREVADLMATCWSNMGQGKLRLFSAQDEKFCVICSVFKFEDTSEKLDGLTSFLMTQKAPFKVNKINPTYYEFMMNGVQTKETIVDQAKKSADLNYLDGSKRYAVMFTYYKASYWTKLKSAVWGAAAGAAAGVVIVVGTAAGLAIAGASFGVAAPVSVMIVTASVAAGAAIGATSANEKSGITTEGADWDANLMVAEYTEKGLTDFGCTALPISQMDEKFR